MIFDIFSIPVQYFKQLANSSSSPLEYNNILVFILNNKNCLIRFYDNIVIVQDGKIIVLDISTPLQPLLPCSNTARYIELDQKENKFTLWCGSSFEKWEKIMENIKPEIIPIKDFLIWKTLYYKDDERILIQHVINYIYSLGFFIIESDKRHKLLFKSPTT